jgi:nitrous oxidase accessory protein NosD
MRNVRLHKKLVFAIILLLFVIMIVSVKPANSQTTLKTIVIQPDGTVSPATAAIQQNGNTYTFTDNIYAAIKILKSNIILDGASYTLSGPYNGSQADIWVIGNGPSEGSKEYVIGVDLGSENVEGVTIEDLNIRNFSIGMYIWTKNNTVTRNSVAENIVGILLSGANNTVSANYIANNKRGVFFGFNSQVDVIPVDIVLFDNSFEQNDIQLNGCMCIDQNTTESPHNWDNGGKGNFWSDYNGTDTNSDGIGDKPYVIDALNKDRYPLMNSPIQPLVAADQNWTLSVILAAALIIIIIAVLLVSTQLKKRA